MRKFGLIGFPLGHSFSKEYFDQKFQREGISDAQYDNYPIEDVAEFENLHQRDPMLHGLNVTIPYKTALVKYLDVLSEDARNIGAVNTVCLCRRTGKLARVGHNTDADGFRRSLEEQLQTTPEKALVLGTGGSSLAIKYVLEQMKVKVISVSSSGKKGSIEYEEIDSALIKSARLVVNCTPVGMHPLVEQFPKIPYQHLSHRHLLFDLIYNPAETAFLKQGKKHGARGVNGYDMLVYQAEGSWAIWNRK